MTESTVGVTPLLGREPLATYLRAYGVPNRPIARSSAAARSAFDELTVEAGLGEKHQACRERHSGLGAA